MVQLRREQTLLSHHSIKSVLVEITSVKPTHCTKVSPQHQQMATNQALSYYKLHQVSKIPPYKSPFTVKYYPFHNENLVDLSQP